MRRAYLEASAYARNRRAFGRPIAEFDVYDLLRRGDKSHDVQLLPGDVIFIPTIGPQVAIVGSRVVP